MNKILSFKDYSEIYINPRRTKSETNISCKKHNNTPDYDYNSDYEYDEYDFFVNVETPFQIQNNTNKSKNIAPNVSNINNIPNIPNVSNINNIPNIPNITNINDINNINDTEIDNIIINPQPFSYKNILNSLYLKLLVPAAIIFFLY
jgi:hypothetical protein